MFVQLTLTKRKKTIVCFEPSLKGEARKQNVCKRGVKAVSHRAKEQRLLRLAAGPHTRRHATKAATETRSRCPNVTRLLYMVKSKSDRKGPLAKS
jgi:hypothetical protein